MPTYTTARKSKSFNKNMYFFLRLHVVKTILILNMEWLHSSRIPQYAGIIYDDILSDVHYVLNMHMVWMSSDMFGMLSQNFLLVWFGIK